MVLSGRGHGKGGRALIGVSHPAFAFPSFIPKLPISSFPPYIRKTDKNLASWQDALLNTMGRAVMVNSVLDSQLIYVMSSISLSPTVIASMDKHERGLAPRMSSVQVLSGMAACLHSKGAWGTRDKGSGHSKCLPTTEAHSSSP